MYLPVVRGDTRNGQRLRLARDDFVEIEREALDFSSVETHVRLLALDGLSCSRFQSGLTIRC